MDIRRYFGGSPQASKAADKNASKKNGTGSKKKKNAVIESDSDDDIFVPKKKQAVKESPPKKTKKSPVKSPAKAEKKAVNIADMFGAAPVKRTAPKTVTKPKLITIEDSDEVKRLESALMDLDESEWMNGNSKEENPGKVKEDSSAKAASPTKDKTPVKANSSAERQKRGGDSGEKSKDKSSEREKHRDRSADEEKPRERRAGKEKHRDGSADKEKHRDRSAGKEIHRDRSPDKEKHRDRSADKEKHRDKSAEKNKYRDKSAEKTGSVEIEKKTPSPSKTSNKESPEKKEEKLEQSRSTNKPLNFANLKRKADSEVSPKDTKLAKTERVEKGSSSKSSGSPSTSRAPLAQLTPQERGELWVDKHKPSSLKQIIGQQGENSNVQKLLRWLSSWHKNHGPGVTKKSARPAPWAKDHNGEFFKAALLSGPPGVGKTTTAHLVCKELGMDVVEFNASDTRSKKLMNAEVTELLSNRTLQPFFSSGGASKTSDKHVLVMDEVDGMAGNEDRGGMQELINLIKNSKCPVICMCNDRQHPKVRSLANYCFDLRFYKPRVEQIRGRMMSVCFNEKIKIKPDALDEVIIGANQDIRQVLHNLSMWCTASKNLSADQARTDASTAKKDIKVGPWDALRSVFSSSDRKNMTLMDKSDLFFTDYNIMPLFVQENYLRATPHEAKTIHETLDHVAKAALSLSTGDLIEKEIRSRNDAWSLLPVQAVFACVAPGDYMEGHLNGQIQFPAWLGKNSNRSKLDRFVQELQTHMRLSISGGKRAVNLEYLQHLQNKLISPLITEGSAGVPAVMQVMRDYFLTREDLDSILELNQWPGMPDPMARVESKVKAALTRAYNKEGVVTPYAIQAPIKKKAGGASAEEGYEEEEGGDSEEDDDSAADAMIKAKPKAAEKGSKAAPSTAAGTSKRGSRGGGARGRGRGRGK